jgi:perosamine synthetase
VTKRVFLARPQIGEEEIALIRSVLQSGFLVEGKVTKEFEETVARYVNARFAVATSSCTTAMETALRALNVSGGEVLVPDFTHPATVNAVISAGGTPVLTDVGLTQRNVTLAQIESRLAASLKAVVGVSLFGNPLERGVYELCVRKGIPIVEDAACTLGAEVDGSRVGSQADATCFSFHPRKIITTAEGGMITTNREDISSFCKAFKSFSSRKGVFEGHGANYRLNDVQAAIGLGQMRRLDLLLSIRARKAKVYDDLLGDCAHVVIPERRSDLKGTYQTYAIYLDKNGIRDRIMSELGKRGIESQIGSYALHLQPGFMHLKRVGPLTNSELLYRRLLALPLHHELTGDDQNRIVATIRQTIEEN